MGKRKIEIKEIESKSKRQVTFSKRRHGLFKKAADMCLLCDARIGIVVFSPAGRPYSFGYPSVETIIDSFLNGSNPFSGDENARKLISLDCSLNTQKAKVKDESGFWWEKLNVDEFKSLEDLQELEKRLVELKEKVLKRLRELESRGADEALMKAEASLSSKDGFGEVLSLLESDPSWSSEDEIAALLGDDYCTLPSLL